MASDGAGWPPSSVPASVEPMLSRTPLIALAGALGLAVAARAVHASPPPAPAPAVQPAADEASRARELVDWLIAGKFAEAAAPFDDAVRAALPPARLEEVWRGLVAKVGAVETIVGSRTETVAGTKVVAITCKFQKASLDVVVAFGPQGKVSGLRVVPTPPAAATKPDAVAPPPYADRATFDETDVEIGPAEWRLPGTLTTPKGAGRFPAVVLVHGSGPGDRDETVGANKPFRDLAWGLASRGIAVLRYDKRSLVHAAKLAGVRDLTVKDEVVDDAVAALAVLRAAPKIDPKRIFVVGHSLGAALVPRIAAADPAIAGAVLLAAPARRLEDAWLAQVEYLARADGAVSPDEAKEIEALRAELAKIKAPGFSAASPPVQGVPASYWIDLGRYDALAAARQLRRPLLLLQGRRDYQVPVHDLGLWEKALTGRKDVVLRAFPALNHLFIAGTGPSTAAEYQRPGHVAVEVVDAIAGWIAATSGRPRAPSGGGTTRGGR